MTSSLPVAPSSPGGRRRQCRLVSAAAPSPPWPSPRQTPRRPAAHSMSTTTTVASSSIRCVLARRVLIIHESHVLRTRAQRLTLLCTWHLQIYLNSKAKIVDGRRIATKFCVENPTLQEILDVLEHLGLECELEVRWAQSHFTHQCRCQCRRRRVQLHRVVVVCLRRTRHTLATRFSEGASACCSRTW